MFPIEATELTPYGKLIPDQYVMERKSKYLHEDDECSKPGGCNGKLEPIIDVLGYCRGYKIQCEDEEEKNKKTHLNWLMCNECHMRYKPVGKLGYIWADAGHYGYMIEYKEDNDDAE